jgi:hypothetical protein
VVIWGTWDACEVPQITFPFVEAWVHAASIEQKHMRVAFDEPATIEGFYSLRSHGFKSSGEMPVLRFFCLDFHGGSFV